MRNLGGLRSWFCSCPLPGKSGAEGDTVQRPAAGAGARTGANVLG